MGNNVDPFEGVEIEELGSKKEQLRESVEADISTPSGQILPDYTEFEGLYDEEEIQERIDPRFQSYNDLRILRAQSQSNLGQMAKGIGKGMVGIPLTIAEGAGYALDYENYIDAFMALTQGDDYDDYSDIDNWLSELARSSKTGLDELLPIYREDPEKTWALGDPAWYAQNTEALIETIGGFGGLSTGVAKGAGYLATRATRAISSRAAVNTLRGGAKVARGAQKAAQYGTNFTVSFAEGVMTGIQGYQQTYNQVKANLQEEAQGLSQQERIERRLTPEGIEERAKNAGGQAAATTTAINALALPFINHMSISTYFRQGRGVGKLQNPNLQRRAGEGIRQLDDYAERISGIEGGPNFVKRELTTLGRESAFESVEELGNELSSAFGTQVGLEREDLGDDQTFGERVVNTLFTPEAGLSAFLGAIGGAGQQGIMNYVPMQEGEDGLISEAQLQRQRHQEYVADEKRLLEQRVNNLQEAHAIIQEGQEENDQKKINKGMQMLQTDATADSISRGVEHQIQGMYDEIANLSEEEAEQLGYNTDQNSPYYYKTLARKESQKIDELSEIYQDLLDQYDFTAQEEFASVPKALLAFKIQERNARSTLEQTEEAIKSREEAVDSLSEQADLNKKRESLRTALNRRNEALKSLQDVLSNVDGGTRNLTLKDIVEEERGNLSSDRPRILEVLREMDQDLFDEIYGNVADMDLDAIDNLIDFAVARNNQELKDQTRSETYEQWLDNNGLEDNKLHERVYEGIAETLVNDRKKELENYGELRSKALFEMNAARDNFNYLVESKGREQLVNRTKEIFNEKRDAAIADASTSLDEAETKAEVDKIMEDLPDTLSNELEERAEDRKNEIDTNARKREAEEQENNIQEDDTKSDKDEVEQEKSIKEKNLERLRAARSRDDGESEEKVIDEGQATQKTNAELLEEARELKNVVRGKRKKDDPNQVRSEISDVVKNSYIEINEKGLDPREEYGDLLDEYNIDDDVKENILEEALAQHNTLVQRRKEDKRSEQSKPKEPKEIAPTNRKNDPDRLEEDLPEYNKKSANKGTNVAYISIPSQEYDGKLYNETTERNEQMEFPLIELPDAVSLGDKVVLRVEEQDFDDDKTHTTRFQLEGRDFENNPPTQEEIDTAVIGIYHINNAGESNFMGYLPRVDNITEKTTMGPKENIQRNVDNNRDIRFGVISNNNLEMFGEVENRTPGSLSFNYETEEDGTVKTPPKKVFQSLNEGFPGGAEIYIIRGEQPYVSKNKSVPVEKLHNDDKFFQNAEGTVGVIVTMGDGQKLAVPVWLPKIRELDEGESIMDMVFKLGLLRLEQGTSDVEQIDISDPSTVKQQIQNYFYTTSGKFWQYHNPKEEVEKPQVYITVNDETGHIRLIDQISGTMHTTNTTEINSEEGIYPFHRDRESNIKESLGRMNINVDVGQINTPSMPQFRLISDGENLESVRFERYNDFIGQYIQTDIDASYSIEYNGREYYLAYEQPSVGITIDTIQSEKTEVPDVQVFDHPENVANSPSEEVLTEEISTTSENEVENNQESEADGDSEDIYTIQNNDTETDVVVTEDQLVEKLKDVINSRAMNNLMDFYENPLDIMNATKEELIDNVNQVGPATSELILETVDNLREDLISETTSEETEEELSEEVDEQIDEEDSELTDIESIKQDYDEINTSTRDSRNTEDIKDAIEELKELRNRAQSLDFELYNEIDNDISDLQEELVRRREDVDDTEASPPEEQGLPDLGPLNRLHNEGDQLFHVDVEELETPMSEEALEEEAKQRENITCNRI